MRKNNYGSFINWLMYFFPFVIIIIAGGMGIFNQVYEIDKKRLEKFSTFGTPMVAVI